MKVEILLYKRPSSLNKLPQKQVFDKSHDNSWSKYLPKSEIRVWLLDSQFSHLLRYWHQLLHILKALNSQPKIKSTLRSLSY